jgi:hypothetical protein
MRPIGGIGGKKSPRWESISARHLLESGGRLRRLHTSPPRYLISMGDGFDIVDCQNFPYLARFCDSTEGLVDHIWTIKGLMIFRAPFQ